MWLTIVYVSCATCTYLYLNCPIVCLVIVYVGKCVVSDGRRGYVRGFELSMRVSVWLLIVYGSFNYLTM